MFFLTAGIKIAFDYRPQANVNAPATHFVLQWASTFVFNDRATYERLFPLSRT